MLIVVWGLLIGGWGVVVCCGSCCGCWKMDGLALLLIVSFIVILFVLIVIAIYGGYVDRFNSCLDEMTGNDEILSPQIKEALKPLEFKVSHEGPNSYSYHYIIPASGVRRTILVSASYDVQILLNGENLIDVLHETRNKRTFAGYLLPSEATVALEVITVKEERPIIHFA